MTTQEKFTSAVNVIKNLPKNGSFQPSTEMQLKFYSYFKQATEGPNKNSKPSFWDIPGQAKWYSWQKLGNMSKEEAMNSYIKELLAIVETMSYNSSVESFLESMGTFYDFAPAKDVDLVFGPVIEKIKSRGNSAEVSRDSSPRRTPVCDDSYSENKSDVEETPQKDYSKSNGIGTNSVYQDCTPSQQAASSLESDDDDDEFTDPMETTPQPTRKFASRSSVYDNASTGEANIEAVKVLKKTVEQMGKDLEVISGRVKMIEVMYAKENKKATKKKDMTKSLQIFASLSPSATAFVIIWPFVVYSLISYMKNKKSK